MSENSLDDLMPNTPNVGDERLAELRRLFPDLFDGEGHLKIEDLKQLTGELPAQRERYDFTWRGKQNAKAEAYQPTTATLTYDAARTVNPEKADGNLIIEGENLAALKCLLPAYKGQVKCIYIDPPYNTGRDFVYSDNYSEGRQPYWEQTGGTEQGVRIDTNPDTAGRYHSNWLNMIYPRLLLARQMLREDGVIFVSIDDNEVHNLRRVLDEVFGEENFIATNIWQKVFSPKNSAQYFSEDHDYILVYSKNAEIWRPNLLPRTQEMEDRYSNPDNDPRGPWASSDLSARNFYGEGTYSITCPSGRVINGPPPGTYWRVSEENFKKLDEDNRIWWGEDGNNTPRQKRFLSEVKDGVVPQTLWKYSDVGHTQEAKKQLISLVPLDEAVSVFNTPKPTRLLQRIIHLTSTAEEEGVIYLDFFAGSGSLGQAVIEQNAEDGGSRSVILVQLPELLPKPIPVEDGGVVRTISDLTIARNAKVIAGYGTEPKPLDTGFKVFLLSQSHFPRLEFAPDPDKTEEENIEALRDYIQKREAQLIGLFPEDSSSLIDEVLLKNGFRLDYRMEKQDGYTANTVWRVTDGYKESLLCLDNTLQAETASALIAEPQPFICLEGALDTSTKWNLKQHLKELFVAF